MAKNAKSKLDEAGNQKGQGQRVAKAGVGALLLGFLIWLTGGFTRENGLEWMKSLLVALSVALVIRWTLAEPFRIPSGSMMPTFEGNPHIFKGDRVFVNKWRYGLRFPFNRCRIPFTKIRINYADKRLWRRSDPKRWDVVVFKSVEENAVHTTLVKRVVGLPGERVHIANGKVYVNGRPLELPPGMPDVYYTSIRRPYPGTTKFYGIDTDDEHSLIPQDCYFLLGDNSAQSRDGRFFGWAPNENIMGPVTCIWWPSRHWRDFTGFTKTWWWRTLVTVLGFLLIVRIFFGRSWRVLVRTEDGRAKVNHLYINRWAFGIPVPFTRFRLFRGRDPQRGELVLYRCPPGVDGSPDLLLGRVAGLPGERVSLDDGRLHIDGKPLRDLPLADREFPHAEGVGRYGRSKGKEHSLVPEGRFFILTESDDPEQHYDSRTAGWVSHSDLVGAAATVWWPPHRWRRIK